jgi:hypothetical protein
VKHTKSLGIGTMILISYCWFSWKLKTSLDVLWSRKMWHIVYRYASHGSSIPRWTKFLNVKSVPLDHMCPCRSPTPKFRMVNSVPLPNIYVLVGEQRLRYQRLTRVSFGSLVVNGAPDVNGVRKTLAGSFDCLVCRQGRVVESEGIEIWNLLQSRLNVWTF